jgi:hypothetical protein
MGYFQHKHGSWKESLEGYEPKIICDFCKEEFQPESPNQKRHRRNDNLDGDEYTSAAACEDEQWKQSLSAIGYVHQVCGMTKAEFIKEFGQETFDTL